MKKFVLCISVLITTLLSCSSVENEAEKPKLVVGIVIDQMRYDYLTRYAARYGNGGFKRLLKEGYSLENAHFNYIPTYTAVGHASIYTGTTPDNHGIIGNNWYDKFLKKSIYCVDDDNYSSVGSTTNKGKKSPYRMVTSTIADQLRLSQNMRGKSIGISIKDRSAILPVGHTANAAYWFDSGFLTSSFYMDKLPTWVEEFNTKNKALEYVSNPWNTLYDISSYKNSLEDDNPYEGKFNGEEKPVFPHDLPNLTERNYGVNIIKETPFGNSLLVDFVKKAIKSEKLGKSDAIDFLSISFSSTDYVGHKYGIDAIETEDTYLRLDKDLENLFTYLDTEVGKNRYTLFLTADHGAVRVPGYLEDLKIPANYFDALGFKNFMNDISLKYFKSAKIVEKISNYQIYLNKSEILSLGLDHNDVAQKLADEAVNFKAIYKAVTARTLQTTNFTTGILSNLQNGYNQKISGDVMLIPNPSTIARRRTGTTHGSGYSYDTHVPIIFYGNGILKGSSRKRYEIIDIAPTIANLLQIEAPNGTTGKVIQEVLK